MTARVIFLKYIFLLCFYDVRISKLALYSPSGEILRGYKSITVHIARTNAKIAVQFNFEEPRSCEVRLGSMLSLKCEELRSAVSKVRNIYAGIS